MTNKKVLLIQPRHGVWDGIFIRFPESVLSIAALPHAKGYDVTILDLRVLASWEDVLKKYLEDARPICVGITSLTGPSLRDLLICIKIIKQVDSTIPVIFGGVHATLLPEQSLAVNGIDIVVKGEGDYTFFNLIKVFEKNTLEEALRNDVLNSVLGVYYYNENILFFTGEALMVNSLDELPDSPYDLLDLPKYNAADLGNGISASFQTSRGCPFACKFCGNEILQKRKMRMLSVIKIVSKIKMFQDVYGYNSFVFVDDLTIASRRHFVEFATALAAIRPKIRWTSTGIRANLISKLNVGDMKLLWESGCRSLDIGIETGSERILKYINKADTKDNMLKANKILSVLPFKTKYTFIIGYPTETDSERNETIDFFLQLQKDNRYIYPMFFVFLPIVGTLLYDEVVSAGFKQPSTMEEWIDMDSTSWFHKHENWIPNSKRHELSMIMIASLFCSQSAKVKFTTFLGRLAFLLYHPIAKLRFRHKYFKFPIESYMIQLIQKF